VERALADLVRERAALRCEYCLMPQEADAWPLEFDHVIAQFHGGATTADNLALACFYCNNSKGTNLAGIDRATQWAAFLFHPRRQQWRRHFRYDGPILIGRTSAGRATVATLRINTMVRIGQRLRWIRDGTFRTS
jgi:hypothetical protein